MRIRKEKIEVYRNGELVSTDYLHRKCPSMVMYRENDDYFYEQAAGKPKERVKLEVLERAAGSYFDAFWDTYEMIMAMDMEEAEAFLAACYESLDKGPEKGKRAKDREDTKKTIIRDAQEERTRKMSPEGRAIFEALEAAQKALDACHDEGGPDEDEKAEAIMEAAEAPLDALALKDPEEATRVFARSSYFDEYISPHAVYLGHYVIADRSILKKLDTPEKRAAYVECGAMPGEDEHGEAVKIDSGEPVTQEGFTEPVIIG